MLGRLLALLESEGTGDIGDWKVTLEQLNKFRTLARVSQICDRALVQIAVLQSNGSATSHQSATRLTRSLEQAAAASSD